MRLKAIDDITDYILVIFGALLFALACNLFIIPLDLYNGGLIGIAQLIRAFIIHVGPVSFSSGIDITGIINFLLNVPLLILAYKNISRKFFTKTVVNVIFQTIFLTLIPIPAVPILTDLLAACLIGGIIAGIGVGLTLRSGGSSGGVDILGVYFTMKYADFSVGKLAVGVNLLVYFICAFAFQLPIAIYSIIYSFCMSLVVDKIHYQNINMTAMIFTKRTGVDKSIMKTLSRGVTYWKGSGAYTDEDTYILVTVVSKYEVNRVKKLVHEIDPQAFIIFNEGMSVSGNFEKRLST
ncbi:MAG: YitT family protein [Erysipelotrichaceae bacterium]